MKTLFLLLFFLSSTSFAHVVEIDTARSKLTFQEQTLNFSGYIDREDERLEIHSSEFSFSGARFTGGEEFFAIEGTLTHNGESRFSKLFGKYLGNSNYVLKNSDFEVQLVGLKTQEEKNKILGRIREIIK